MSEQFPGEKFRPVLWGAELCPAGRRPQCSHAMVQEGAEGLCVDGRVPAGIFVSEGPVDPCKRGSEPSWRLCFLGVEMSVGVLRIWRGGRSQLGCQLQAPRGGGELGGDHRQMLLVETAREFSFLTW